MNPHKFSQAVNRHKILFYLIFCFCVGLGHAQQPLPPCDYLFSGSEATQPNGEGTCEFTYSGKLTSAGGIIRSGQMEDKRTAFVQVYPNFLKKASYVSIEPLTNRLKELEDSLPSDMPLIAAPVEVTLFTRDIDFSNMSGFLGIYIPPLKPARDPDALTLYELRISAPNEKVPFTWFDYYDLNQAIPVQIDLLKALCGAKLPTVIKLSVQAVDAGELESPSD